jgi:hypothetical protein
MFGTSTQMISGRITIVQEQRFHLISDAGQGMLFTLAHNTSASTADLRHFLNTNAHVLIEYTGEPNLASGAAQAVRAVP